MSILHVQWTVKPMISPQPRLRCGRCGEVRAFKSSGKIRLNANGRRLDAWLIYHCADCDNVLNRTIFERRNVAEIEPAMLDALHRNDPGWIDGFAFDVEGLKRISDRVDEFSEVEVAKSVLADPDSNWIHLKISLRVLRPTGLRLDRLLASELNISRARLQVLDEQGCLQTTSSVRKAVRNDLCVIIDLADEQDHRAIGLAARG